MRWNEFAPVITAVAATIALAGGYVQFVLRRALYPCVEFDVDFVVLRTDETQKVGDIVLTIKNVGPGAGYVHHVQGRVRYARDGETEVNRDGVEPVFSHRIEPQTTPEQDIRMILDHGGFLFAPNWPRAFVQPGVTQTYRKPLSVPGEAVLIHHTKTPRRLDYTVRRTFRVDQAP